MSNCACSLNYCGLVTVQIDNGHFVAQETVTHHRLQMEKSPASVRGRHGCVWLHWVGISSRSRKVCGMRILHAASHIALILVCTIPYWWLILVHWGKHIFLWCHLNFVLKVSALKSEEPKHFRTVISLQSKPLYFCTAEKHDKIISASQIIYQPKCCFKHWCGFIVGASLFLATTYMFL